MYGSHNSMTCYKPKNFIHKILQIFSKTQNLSIPEQIHEGCRVFDLRVRLDCDYNLIACHGLCEYKVDVMSVISLLEKHKCYYRIVLEDTLRKTDKGDLDHLKQIFISDDDYPYCMYVCDKKHWDKTSNTYCKLSPNYLRESNCHKESKWPLIPRLCLNKYKKNKKSDSLNKNKKTVFWYDYVEIK